MLASDSLPAAPKPAGSCRSWRRRAGQWPHCTVGPFFVSCATAVGEDSPVLTERAAPSIFSRLDSPRHLAVAFPIGVLLRDDRIVHRRLDLPGCVDRSRGDRVFSDGGTWPVERPDLPCVFGFLAVIDGCRHPWPVVDLHLNAVDRRPPRNTNDAIIRAYLRNPCWSRLEAGAPDGCLGPHRFAVVIFLADGDVVSPHEETHEAPIAHFNALQPFGICDAIPARRDQPKRETVGCRQRRSVHLVAEDVVGAHGIFERHAASEVLLELDVADCVVEFDVAAIGSPEHHLDAVIENSCLFKDWGERRAGPMGVADAADEIGKAMIARAFDRKRNLLSRPRFDVVEGQGQGLLDETVDLQLPSARIDDRPVEMRDREELLVRRDPGVLGPPRPTGFGRPGQYAVAADRAKE